jgi:hypothetical protein
VIIKIGLFLKLTGKQTQFILVFLPWSVAEDTLAALTLIILFSEMLKFSPQKKKKKNLKEQSFA